jgi:hypothetical protein
MLPDPARTGPLHAHPLRALFDDTATPLTLTLVSIHHRRVQTLKVRVAAQNCLTGGEGGWVGSEQTSLRVSSLITCPHEAWQGSSGGRCRGRTWSIQCTHTWRPREAAAPRLHVPNRTQDVVDHVALVERPWRPVTAFEHQASHSKLNARRGGVHAADAGRASGAPPGRWCWAVCSEGGVGSVSVVSEPRRWKHLAPVRVSRHSIHLHLYNGRAAPGSAGLRHWKPLHPRTLSSLPLH